MKGPSSRDAFIRSHIIGLTIITLLILIAYHYKIFAPAENIISASIFSSSHNTSDNSTIVIDYSGENITRATLASLIQKLSNYQAKSILLDVNLSDPSDSYVDDNLLMETIKANKSLSVVLPIYKNNNQIIRPLTLFSKHAKSGYIDLKTTEKELSSEIELVLKTPSKNFPHAAVILLNQDTAVGSTYIQPGSDKGSIPIIPFNQIDVQDKLYFTNKIVIAGDHLGRSIKHALLIGTLKNGEVSEIPWYLLIFIFLIFSALLINQFNNKNRYKVLLLTGVIIFSPLIISYISIIFFRTLFPSALLTSGVVSISALLAYLHRDHYSLSLKAFKIDNKHDNTDDSLQELLEGDISIGKNGVILKADPIASKLLGFRNKYLVGSPLRIIAPSLNQEKWATFYHDLMNLRQPTEHLFELKAKHQNGKKINLQLQPKSDSYISATVAHFHIRNTKGKSGAQVTLEYQAKQDCISRTLNSAGINEHLYKLISNNGNCKPFSIAILRLDNFSEITNTLGEDSAHKIIKSFSERLHQTTTNIATVGRMTTSDFIIIFDEKATNDSITKILNSSKNAIHASGISIELSLHAGIAEFPQHGKTPNELFKTAKMALINAISSNKIFANYIVEKQTKTNTQNNSLLEIHTALKENQFQLFYQPIINVATHSISSIEALIRWKHPSKGLLSPSEFIDQVEHSKLVRPITKWVINKALQDTRELERYGLKISVSVNISERNLLDAHFPAMVAECINKNKMSAKSIEFEISEKKLELISEQALTLLARFKNNGINFTLDNYGAENTSLLNLRELPFSKIKIYKSLASNVIKSNQDEVVIDAIVRLAHGFDISVVAEGVESELHYKKLRDLNIDYCQGHLFSKPVNKQALIEQFKAWDNTMDDSQEIPAQAMATWNGKYSNS